EREVRSEVLVRAEPAARHRVSARCDPVAEMRDRAGAESDVDERVLLEDTLALRLGVAPSHRDDHIRAIALHRSRIPEVRPEPRIRLLADRAGIEDDDVCRLGSRGFAEAEG